MDKPLANGTTVDYAAWNQFATSMIMSKSNLADHNFINYKLHRGSS